MIFPRLRVEALLGDSEEVKKGETWAEKNEKIKKKKFQFDAFSSI